MDASLPPPYIFGEGYIILPVIAPVGLPDTVVVNEKPLLKKYEFHVSLVCLLEIAPMLSAAGHGSVEEVLKELVSSFTYYVKETPIELVEWTGELRHVVEGENESVVALVNVAGLAGYFATCEKVFGLPIPLQSTHVTLYTHEPNTGISVSSEAQMELYPKALLPEVSAVLLA